MGRRSGLEGFLRAAVRASAAAERERQRAIRGRATQARQLERQERMARNQQLRDAREADRLSKKDYLDDRIAETNDLNEELAQTVQALAGIVDHTLKVNDAIRFDSLRRVDEFEKFKPPENLQPSAAPAPRIVAAPSGFAKLIPGATSRYEKELKKADDEHKLALEEFQRDERDKRSKFNELKAAYEARKAQFDTNRNRHNAEIDEFESAYMKGAPESLVAYCEMILARSEYPEIGFPQKFKVAYGEASREIVVEYDLPEFGVVPEVAEHKYIKSKDRIESKPRKDSERKQLYQDVVASIALRTIHELLEADQANAIELVTFTGVVDTVSPATGQPIRVPVISVRAPKANFLRIRLDKIDKALCLKNLGAKVAARPDELQAVKPIVEFSMVDRRFVDQGDALSGLESRPNLLEMTPTEFEVLVANLFGKMGLESKLTRASRDGGVDAVAYDARPVLGGKVVIQAKRYRNTVGVEAVRDLYGTMLNEGANKGILVTTSGYGPDAYNFSKDKPVELIDGGGLLYLLREHAGIDARIAA